MRIGLCTAVLAALCIGSVSAQQFKLPPVKAPAIKPPVTNPAVTNPAVTNPPLTNPPVVNAPVVKPPLINIPAVKPVLANEAGQPQVIKLWAGKVPGETGGLPPEGPAPSKAAAKSVSKSITNVSDPTITIFHPKKADEASTAVIVAPGGGYNVLAWEHEGTQVAQWLNERGVTAVLLKYRVPRRADQPKEKPPVGALQDAQRAVSLVRSKAKEWGIKADHIGFLGFSAGGHLTAWVSTSYDKRAYEPIDAADEQSSRPDFAVLIYAGGVVSKTSPEQMNPEIRVTAQTPPAFLVHAADDSFQNSIAYFQALRQNKVQAELHIYGSGGHGFGMRAIPHPAATWTKRCEDWMAKQGFLTQ